MFYVSEAMMLAGMGQDWVAQVSLTFNEFFSLV
jgi:hypothetical protein